MTNLNDTAIKAGVSILATTRPELAAAVQIATILLNGWQEQAKINAAISAIDSRAAEHIKRLTEQKLTPFQQLEVETRLHELLTVLNKLGGL